jgi:hypothetical protein
MLTLDEIDAALDRARNDPTLSNPAILDALLDARTRVSQQLQSTDQ